MNFKAVILSVVVGLCLAPMTASAQSNPNDRANAGGTAALEKEVLRLEEAGRQKILKGDNNWDDLIAEGAYMIGYDGSIVIYQKGLQFPPMPVKSFEMSEMIARVYGEAVVVTGLAEVVGETTGTGEKKTFSFKMRFLNVWKKSGDSWKIVVSERTGVRPPAK
jgi:uncharacterized protein DUF4440